MTIQHIGRTGLLAATLLTLGSAVAQTLPPPPISPAPVVTYEYDAQGHPTKTVQAPGVAGFSFETKASYDPLSRLKDTTDPKAGRTQFGYNGREDLTQVTDPRNLVTQYPRNGLGDATSLLSPDTGTATHTFDAAGNLKTRTDSRGVLATHSYDALNRLTQSVFSKTGMTTQTFGWTYDQTGAGFSHGVGRLTSTAFPAGSTQTAYDAQGRVVTQTQRMSAAAGANPSQITGTVGYGYAAGQLTGITYPSGRKLTLAYTNGVLSGLSLAKDASSTPVALITQLKWLPFGGPKSWLWSLSSGTQLHERVSDLSGRLVRYRLGAVLRDVSYDAADRITGFRHYDAGTGVAQTSLDQSFGYDPNGQLTGITTATASWTITYDANGNRTGVSLNGSPSSYTTAATSNRLSSTTNPARSFGYDSAGNTTSDASYTATFDASGRMATLTKGGITTTYAYDNRGQRVRKFSSTGASSTVVFVSDKEGRLLGEYSNTGAPLREYIYLGDIPVAMFVPDVVATNPPLIFYIHSDHINTPRVVVDKNNAIRWRWMAEPFGTTAPEMNPSGLGVFTQPLRMPGQYADSESGLFDNWHRSLDSTTGRYNTSDPIGLAGGINTYAYVKGNPLSKVDPLGLLDAPLPNPLGPDNKDVPLRDPYAPDPRDLPMPDYTPMERRPYIPPPKPPVPPPGNSDPWPGPDDQKGQCIRLSVQCRQQGWRGNCNACELKCIAQGEWPFRGPVSCRPKKNQCTWDD